MTKHYIFEAVLIISLGLSFFFSWSREKEIEVQVIEVRDTIFITNERIVERTKNIYTTKYDTIVKFVNMEDTIFVPVELPIEHKKYQDTINGFNIDIKYSGYKACLEDVSIKYQANIQKPVRRQKNGILGQSIVLGAHVGVGVDRNFQFSPYVGIGITYGFGYSWKR